MPKKKGKLEFRYYEIPRGERVLALYGDVWVRPYGYDEHDRPITDLHFHNLLEIGLCCEGHGEIVLESESHRYSGGTLTVIPKNFPHTTNAVDRRPNKWEYLFLDMDQLLQELYPSNSHLAERLLYRVNKSACCTSAAENPRLTVLARQILEEMKRQDEFYRESVFGLLRALIVEMARLNQERAEEKIVPGRQKRPELAQIMRALEYVGDHYDREIRIGDLAGACHMSETHFRRLFVKYMRMHPVDYVNQIRIKMACEQLKKTNGSVAEIAMKCGFCSSATFNRNFRKFMGTTPNEWKNLPENYERRLSNSSIAYYDGW